jgi:hypothetical protein
VLELWLVVEELNVPVLPAIPAGSNVLKSPEIAPGVPVI